MYKQILTMTTITKMAVIFMFFSHSDLANPRLDFLKETACKKKKKGFPLHRAQLEICSQRETNPSNHLSPIFTSYNYRASVADISKD